MIRKGPIVGIIALWILCLIVCYYLPLFPQYESIIVFFSCVYMIFAGICVLKFINQTKVKNYE